MEELFADDVDTVGAAIARGGDVNACRPEGDMPLHVACRAGNLEVVKLLVAKGADVNAEDRTAVCRTPLHYAADAYAGDTEGDPRFEEVLQVLVDAGAVSLADKKGNLPSVGDEADFVVQKLMERAEKGGEAARKAQKERRMQAARDIMNAKQDEYQKNCSAAMVSVMDSGSHEGYKGAMHLNK